MGGREVERASIALYELGSIVAGGVVLPIVAGSIAIACAVLRKWRLAAFVVFSLGVESATYRATTLVGHTGRVFMVSFDPMLPSIHSMWPSVSTRARFVTRLNTLFDQFWIVV